MAIKTNFVSLLLSLLFCLNLAVPQGREIIEQSIKIQAKFCGNQMSQRNDELEKNIVLQRIVFEGLEFRMYVYRSNDEISDEIRSVGSYEYNKTLNMFNALMKHMKVHGIVHRDEIEIIDIGAKVGWYTICLLYTSPSPRDLSTSRMPSSA
eukprot:TRINITY_DN2553_c0_g1_i33.p2 TRINITY_DN2553_c0_g1~~TRINITY_DN2553_c0_g1_i33.p2  ORF type:complete len:151 (+),score=31.84 TRINITY_DN2553_c0_g1_i33:103-555(+)